MTVAVQQELPSTQIGLRLETPSGYKNRLAEDEPSASNVISDIEISTEMPGGYKEMNFTLGRDPQDSWRDLVPFTDGTAYIPGVGVVFQGALDKAPGVSGEQNSLTPSFLGYQSILEDNQAVQIGFIDGDLGKWGDVSIARRNDVLKGSWAGRPFQFSMEAINGFQDKGVYGPGIAFILGNCIAGQTPFNEQMYYGEGVDIGAIIVDFQEMTGFGEDANFRDLFGLAVTDEIVPTFDLYPEPGFKQVSHAQAEVKAGGSGRKYAWVQCCYIGNLTITEGRNTHGWLNIRILGDHGLTPQGVWPHIGFTAKQMLEYAIPKIAAPLTIDPNYVDDDGYIIPQAWYGEPTGATEVIKDFLKYGWYDWFVYHNKRFELRQPGSYGRYWKAYTAPSQLNEVGLDSQRLWRSIIVTYQDVDGSVRTVGPIGSGCNVESAELEINDPSHPAVQAGRTRKDVLDLQGVGVPSTAIAVGKRFLEEANLINRSGSATLAGYVMDQYGVMWPSVCVKSGDWISFVDASDTSYRKIVGTTYRHSEVSNEIDLDAPESGLEALLERLQAGLISLGVN